MSDGEHLAAIWPAVDPLSEPYWTAAAAGAISLQHCVDCADVWHPPMPRCPRCHSARYEWRAASGRGVIHAFTDVVHPVHDAVKDSVPYRVLLVDLEEGPRLVAGAVGAARERIDIVGAPVRAVFRTVAPGVGLPMFALASDAAAA